MAREVIEQETVTGSNEAALPSGDVGNSSSGFTKGCQARGTKACFS